MAPLHSVSTSSVFTLLDTLAHTKPATIATQGGRYTVTLLDGSGTNHLGGSLTERPSPKTLSGADDGSKRHSLGCDGMVEDSKAVWSDLDMTCFSESDSEQFEDGGSKSYFKVENLGKATECLVRFDSGCGECNFVPSDVRRPGTTGDQNSSILLTACDEISPSGAGEGFGGARLEPSRDSCLQTKEQVAATDDSGFNSGTSTSEHII